MNDIKLPPYQRLKSILTEGELTEKASDNLDEILGIKKKEPNFVDKIIGFFKKIDSLIFRKSNRMYNTTPSRRK